MESNIIRIGHNEDSVRCLPLKTLIVLMEICPKGSVSQYEITHFACM